MNGIAANGGETGGVLQNKARRLPDYLIIGSMKCGTTILNEFICRHPNVVAAKMKEIHYFSMYYDKGIDWYSDFFEGVGADQVVGEASPTYLAMSDNIVMPNLINTILPNVKIIAILKNPVQRAISHFYHLRDINKLEKFQGLDINEVLSGNLAEKYFGEFSADHSLWSLKHVLQFGNYYSQLVSFSRVFGKRMIVIENNDLWNSPNQVMSRVYQHLELEDFQSQDFARKSYVTSHKAVGVSDQVIESLKEFYRSDSTLLKRSFRIDYL